MESGPSFRPGGLANCVAEDPPSSFARPRAGTSDSDVQTKNRVRAVSIVTPTESSSDEQDENDRYDDLEFELNRHRRFRRFRLARLQDCYDGKAVKERLAGVNSEMVRLSSNQSSIGRGLKNARLSADDLPMADAGVLGYELEAWLEACDSNPALIPSGESLADASRHWTVYECGIAIDKAPKEARTWLDRRKPPPDPWAIEAEPNLQDKSIMKFMKDDMVDNTDDRPLMQKSWRYHIVHLSRTRSFMIFGGIVLLVTALFMAWEARARVNLTFAEALRESGNTTKVLKFDLKRASMFEFGLILVTWLEVTIRIVGCSQLVENPFVVFDGIVTVAWTVEYLFFRNQATQLSLVAMLRAVRLHVAVYQNSKNHWLKPLHIVMHAGFLGIVDMFNIVLLLGVFIYYMSVALALAIGPASGYEYPEGEEPPFAELGSGLITWVQCIINGIEWGPEVLDKLLPANGGPSDLGVALFVSFLWFAHTGPMNLIASLLIERTCVARQAFAKKHIYKDKTALDTFELSLEEMSSNDTCLVSWPDVRYVLQSQPQHLAAMGVSYETIYRLSCDVRVDGLVAIQDLKFAIARDTRKIGDINVETLSYQQRRICELIEDFDSSFAANTKVLLKLVEHFGNTATALSCDVKPLREDLEGLISRIRTRVEAASEENQKKLEDMAAKQKKGEEAKREAEQKRAFVAAARGSLALDDAFFAPAIRGNIDSAHRTRVAFHGVMKSWFEVAERAGRPQMTWELSKAISRTRLLEEETDETSQPPAVEQAARSGQRPAQKEQGHLLGTALAPALRASTNPLRASSAIAPAKPGSSLGRIVD